MILLHALIQVTLTLGQGCPFSSSMGHQRSCDVLQVSIQNKGRQANKMLLLSHTTAVRSSERKTLWQVELSPKLVGLAWEQYWKVVKKNCRYFPVLTADCRLLGGGPGAALRGTEAGGSLESQKNKQAISSWKSGNSNPSYCAKMHAICSGLALSSAFALCPW